MSHDHTSRSHAAVTTTDARRSTALLPRLGAWRGILTAVAIAATLPYLTLKIAWLAGSHIGIPAGSVLLEPRLFLTVANAVTVLMDASVIALVLVLTRPWGKRVPSWLLTVPTFVATGLLTPIVLGFPGQLLLRGMGLGPDTAKQAANQPFLDDWVFQVVYSGFILQAIALAGLFVPYARERWGGAGKALSERGFRHPRGWWREPRRRWPWWSLGRTSTGPSAARPDRTRRRSRSTPRTPPWAPRSTGYAR